MKKSTNIPFSRIVTVLVMCFCLFLLTGSNFFIYNTHSSKTAWQQSSDANEEEAPAPVEEKSSSKTGLTIQEEYIHELHALELSTFIILSKHKMPSAEKLQVVHFELDAPPPKA